MLNMNLQLLASKKGVGSSKNGRDSISKRLGHAQVSTTANIYAHVMEEADKRNAEVLSDIFLKTQNF